METDDVIARYIDKQLLNKLKHAAARYKEAIANRDRLDDAVEGYVEALRNYSDAITTDWLTGMNLSPTESFLEYQRLAQVEIGRIDLRIAEILATR